MIVDYRGEQFVAEIKLWRGNEYNKRGEKQLMEYMDDYRVKRGYLLSFNFSKKEVAGAKEIALGERTILEVVV